jgi:hypothetical protein
MYLEGPTSQARARKWLLQEDRSYKPDFSEQSDETYVSSMITSSNDKPCRPEDPKLGNCVTYQTAGTAE